MKYVITEEDKAALLQNEVQYHYRMYVTDTAGKIVDVLKDFLLSGFCVESGSNMRRTLSVTIHKKYNVARYINTCLMYHFKLQMGVYSLKLQQVLWYECGTFVPIDASTTYDAATNSISFSLGDCFSKLNGTRNGQIGGAQTIRIPNQDEDGNFVELKSVLANFIKAEGISDYIIDDLGEFYGIQSNNPDGYEEYRCNNPLWNTLPHDLEFDGGCTDADIITEIVELYPNTQAYFDVFNHFCAGVIPSCSHNPIELDNDFLQKILLSENSQNVTYDIQSIRNVTEVFGSIYDIDRYAQSCFTSSNVYTLTLENYESYSAYEYVAFTPDSANIESMQLKINSLAPLPLYQEYSTTAISAGSILADKMCVVRIMRDAKGGYMAYYLGEYQPHAVCVLTGNAEDSIYTKAYFREKYNCSNVILREEPDSPFTVQKLGEILDVKSGDEFENILSDTIAAENAIYFNRKTSSLNETVEITTKLIPWLDVQCKVSYKKVQEAEVCEYIIDAVKHSDTTSTITMRKFYPLYYK